jgi:hypothetical protein
MAREVQHQQAETRTKEAGTILSRTLSCSIRGSLNQFAHCGQEAACWTTQNGRINDILGVTELLDGAADQTSATALIKTAYLHNVTVLEYLNGFPLPLGVSISCVPSRECTRTGAAYAFSTLPEVTNTTPLVIYQNEHSTHESMSWRAQYPEFNVNNLESHGVLNVQGENFVFVAKTHPVIDLLRINKDILNADIDTQALIDDCWYKVTKQVMSTCCQQLKTKVLNKVGTVDLNQLSVQISRLDGIHWLEMSENDELFSKIPTHLTTALTRPEDISVDDWHVMQAKRKEDLTTAANILIKTPYSFHARIKIEFELMPPSM